MRKDIDMPATLYISAATARRDGSIQYVAMHQIVDGVLSSGHTFMGEHVAYLIDSGEATVQSVHILNQNEWAIGSEIIRTNNGKLFIEDNPTVADILPPFPVSQV